MKTYSDIKAEIARLEARANAMRESEKAGVVGRIRDAIAVYGITAADLGLGGGSRSAAAKPAAKSGKIQMGVAKYRDPASGKTWTGRGKPPNWIVGAKDRSAFLINGEAPAPRSRAKAAPRKASNVGVAKYRDAATGKTWTGRGKPPNWIAGVSDRSQFLIDPQNAG
jgi:DNA-binding protein H-NS